MLVEPALQGCAMEGPAAQIALHHVASHGDKQFALFDALNALGRHQQF
jgi:hypothetical protein